MTDLLDDSSELLAELAEVVAETLDGLVEAGAVTLPLPAVPLESTTVVEAWLDIVGEGLRARLTVRTPLASAIALTAGFIDEPADDITTEDACGTLAELCNVFGGSAKTLFEEESALEVPTCHAVDAGDLSSLPATQIIHELGTFDVHVGGD